MQTKLRDWVTNNSELAMRLEMADRNFVAAREAARNLPLADKVAAYRKASEDYDEAYNAVIKEIGESDHG